MSAAAPIALPTLDPQRRALAMHEAGHVVAILHLWPRRRFVASLRPTPEERETRIGGAVRPVSVLERWPTKSEPARWFGWYKREYLRRRAIECYAGAAAESFRTPLGSLTLEAVQSSEMDRRQLVEYARSCGRARPLLDWNACRKAQVFVDAHFGEVLAIADELERVGVVNSKRARALAEAASALVNERPTW